MCQLFFLAPKGRFAVEHLSERLGIPAEDLDERARFPKTYRNAFWRIRIAAWTANHDEIGLALRSVEQVRKTLPLLKEEAENLSRQP